MDANKLNSVLQRAKRLTDLEASGKMNQIAENARNNGKMSYDPDAPDVQYISENNSNLVPNSQPIQNYQPVQNFSSPRNASSMPKEILESFQTNPINTNVPGMNPNSSILDQLGIGIVNENNEQQSSITSQKRVIKENFQTQNPISQGTSSVDYSLIKDIIENAVKKYVGAYTKKMISENKQMLEVSNKLSALQIGDKFNFVTENGDLYRAKLEFIKNIKNK